MWIHELCRDFATIVNDWKLAIIIKSSYLDIDRIFGSAAGRFRFNVIVYHAVHDQFYAGGAAPNFRKS